jgi:hypothetical protein
VIFLTNHRILNKVLSNAANRGSFLLNSNRVRGGVQNKDSGRSTIAKIDVIEGAEAYLYIHESISLQACQLESLPAG